MRLKPWLKPGNKPPWGNPGRSKDNHQRKGSEKLTELCAQSIGEQNLAAPLTQRNWPFMHAMKLQEHPQNVVVAAFLSC